MADIEGHVADNYRKLREERGLSWEQLAAQTGPQDRRLAAWMRAQASSGSVAEARAVVPQGRRRSPHADA